LQRKNIIAFMAMWGEKMKKIAIIGTGISGLGAAYHLRNQARLTVFEKEPRLGGHTRTLNVNYDGKPVAVDTGFIVYNNENYPHLLELFKQLAVAVKPSDMSFAASIDDGAMEWAGHSLATVFAQKRNLLNPQFLKGLWDVLRFYKHAEDYARTHPLSTLETMLKDLKNS
jgi:predicted NAD/FAD-binding protein